MWDRGRVRSVQIYCWRRGARCPHHISSDRLRRASNVSSNCTMLPDGDKFPKSLLPHQNNLLLSHARCEPPEQQDSCMMVQGVLTLLSSTEKMPKTLFSAPVVCSLICNQCSKSQRASSDSSRSSACFDINVRVACGFPIEKEKWVTYVRHLANNSCLVYLSVYRQQ